MSVLAHLEPLEAAPQDRRGAPRLLLSLGTSLGPCGSSVTIHDLSRSGLLFETSADLSASDSIEVQLPEMGPTRAVVVWREGSLFGCKFENEIPSAAVSAALLRSEPAAAPSSVENFEPAAERTRSRGWAMAVAALVVAGLAYQMLTAGFEPMAAVAALVSLVIALLVLWGLWVTDNTVDFKL